MPYCPSAKDKNITEKYLPIIIMLRPFSEFSALLSYFSLLAYRKYEKNVGKYWLIVLANAAIVLYTCDILYGIRDSDDHD